MRWIRSPAWDFVWILNAMWLAPLVLLLAQGHDDVRASPVDVLFFALAVPLWFGHRVSSAWLAYATPAYRPLLATQRVSPGCVGLAALLAGKVRYQGETTAVILSGGNVDPALFASVLAGEI